MTASKNSGPARSAFAPRLLCAVILIANVQAARAGVTCVVGTGASCTEAALDACLPGGADFTGAVTFNCGPSPTTITVSSTKSISANTSIDGGGLVTLDGNHAVAVFLVAQGSALNLENLTIVNGLYHCEDSCEIRPAGAIHNSGIVTVSNSTFSGNGGDFGGAISNGDANGVGTLTVTNSTFFGNSASIGGGIDNFSGTVTVTNSTFFGNNAIAGGGAIVNWGTLSTLTVTNSTFAGNSAGFGSAIVNDSGTLNVTNSIFFGNSGTSGGGISNSGTLALAKLINTILADNIGGNCDGAITDGGHNLDDGTTCAFSTANGSLSNTDPKLNPAGLKDNGGPTQTIALLAGSPAINAGDQTVCATAPINNLDQRGYVRPGTGYTNCSIGAYEFNSPGPPPPCIGDCLGDHQVTVDELLMLVNIALGDAEMAACEVGDDNEDGEITVDEIIVAVNNALKGC